ncbi:MAG: signal recognition particle protein [Puniceicoccaceae bacterium]
MFDSLTERLGKAMRNLRGVGKLSEANMEEALKEVRTALLSADVHFKVAREFVSRVKATVVGTDVLSSVTPGQQVVKIINDELVRLLGEGSTELLNKRPLKIMMVGLHGSGKTTTSAKLALLLSKKGYKPALIACDVYRPAAIDQLEQLAKQGSFGFFANRQSRDVPAIGKQMLREASEAGHDLLIFDTAGRLQIDHDLIGEIQELKDRVRPDEILLVADAALGQEAVNVATHFHEAVALSGIVLTKLDGDARGGAALSMKEITGVPIKFAGFGEKLDALDVFHPDRMASRILGMGDVVSLVEKAQATVDAAEAERLAEKMQRAEFDLEDFLSQMKQVKKMGSMGSILRMLPGMSGVQFGDREQSAMGRTEAIILSMTKKERRNPRILNGSRRMRIANGSGTQVKDVNQLLKQFTQMQKMMRQMRGSKGKKMMKALGGKMGAEGGSDLAGFPGGFPGMGR